MPRLTSKAWRIAGLYAVFAALWIYFSDSALHLLIPDPDTRLALSVYKGLTFVVVTSVLLWLLMRQSFGTIEAGYRSLVATERQRLEHLSQIERLSRLYAALSHVNQVIARAKTRPALFGKVCEALVEYGGFEAAWVGWHDERRQVLEPVAHRGMDDDFVSTLEISTTGGPPPRRPALDAFQRGQTCVCNDLAHDAFDATWRAGMLRRRLLSAAAIPIRMRGHIRGTLNVYAAEPGFFEDKEIALLDEATVDLSHALDALKLAREHRRAEDRARRERLFSRMMIECMPGVFYLYDEGGHFLRWNKNFETLSGYAAAEIAQMKPFEFFPPAHRGVVAERIAEVFERGEVAVEGTFLSKDGRETPCLFTGRRVEFEGRRCLVGVGIDITQRKEAENRLRGMNQQLELKVEERTADLLGAKDRAEAADRIKSAFLATMSHELRTPLNSIIGFTGTVLQGLAGPLNEEQSKQLGMVRGSARHLLGLVNDVLDISKIEARQLQIHPEAFAMREAVEEVLKLVQPLAEAKGLALLVEMVDPGSIRSDRRRVKQILINLLNNAIKFTHTGEVALHVERVDDEAIGPAMQLRVRDTGIGIKADDLATLFQPFQQVDNGLTRQHDGTGLGLAICGRLATLLGGRIGVVSEWSQGSEFTVTLPLQARVVQ